MHAHSRLSLLAWGLWALICLARVRADGSCFNFHISYSSFSWKECPTDSEAYLANKKDSPIAGYPYTIPSSYAKNDSIVLPASSEGLLLNLVWITPDCSLTAVSRSYDGYDWEGVHPDPLQPECNANGACSVTLRPNADGVYRIDATVSASQTLEVLASRLLLQGTFGPTTLDVADLTSERRRVLNSGGGPSQDIDGLGWILEQVEIEPSYHRAHFRTRVNARSPGGDALSEGTLSTPCDAGTRWSRYAFTYQDRGKELLMTPVHTNTSISSCYLDLQVDGTSRTQLKSFQGYFCDSALPNNATVLRYMICEVPEEKIGGAFGVAGPFSDDEVASCDSGGQVTIPHPALHFFVPDILSTQVYEAGVLQFLRVAGQQDAYYLPQRPACSGAIQKGHAFIGVTPAAGYAEEEVMYYKLDVRRVLITNTPQSPADVNSSSAQGACPAVQKNFVNAESCVRREPSRSCSSSTFASASLTMDTETLRSWFAESSKYVYYVRNLQMDDVPPPCTASVTSRWVRSPGSCPPQGQGGVGSIDNETAQIVIAALNSHGGGYGEVNPNIRDVQLESFSNGSTCDASAATVGASVEWNGDCWRHYHPSEFNVYDFTLWVFSHPGTSIALSGGRRDPIRRWAENDLAYIEYPSHHPMSRWIDGFEDMKYGQNPYLGRLNDTIDFSSLPSGLQTGEMANRVGATTESSSVGFEACGSRGEVANNNSFGSLYIGYSHIFFRDQGLDRQYYFWDMGPTYVWQTVVFHAKDQLRQRVAWALANFIVARGEGTHRNAEPLTTFHDIFVHNAFGNFRDILREISTSPIMAAYLTFEGNSAFSVDRKYPDENYARELMQLFTIGVWELNKDGTEKRDPVTGWRVPTYNNDDITNAARVWTGWFKRPFRGNLIAMSNNERNFIDPMQVQPHYRDRLPKTKLGGGYLGDGFELCSELPPMHFLLEDAKYTLIGSISAIGEFYDKLSANESITRKREHFTPHPTTSELYAALCAVDVDSGKCTFPPVVRLKQTLACDGAVECGADTLRVVKIVDAADGTVLYYSYEERPCTHMTLFDDGQLLVYSWGKQCADPSLVTMAGTACCDSAQNVVSDLGGECGYLAEPMKYTTAQQRCAAEYNGTVCPDKWSLFMSGLSRTETPDVTHPEFTQTCSAWQHRWTTQPCSLQVQIDAYGRINLVDSAQTYIAWLNVDSGNKFEVFWNAPGIAAENDTHSSQHNYPTIVDGTCGTTGCVASSLGGGTCLCDLWVETSAVYTNASHLPSASTLRHTLFIGASPPSHFGEGGYTLCTTVVCTSQPKVAVYTKGGSQNPDLFDRDTIFELMDAPGMRTKKKFLLNRKSNVVVGTNPSALVQLTITSCNASSEFPYVNNGIDWFACERALDGTDSSQWASNAEGEGAWIDLMFNKSVTISTMKFSNRCSTYNSKLVLLSFSDGSNQTVEVSDACAMLSYPLRRVTTTFVRITTLSMYDQQIAAGARQIEFHGPILENDVGGAYSNRLFSFRNPPNFNANIGAYARTPPLGNSLYELYGPNDVNRKSQAMHETDALIDTLFEHDNMAPFLATRLIQRLVTSNPSPRYVRVVAEAFTSGTYGNHTFSGKYGDMSATVAAILLDREARSPILDSDPTHGQLREPILKVLHMMRSMDYTTKEGVEIQLQQMVEKIGQGAFQQPSVFSFYLPDYSPDGPVAARRLVSPEAQLGTAPFVIGYLNGMDGLIQNGLTNCNLGFGDETWTNEKRGGCDAGTEAVHADGAFTYRVRDEFQDVQQVPSTCSASLDLALEHDYVCAKAIDDNYQSDWASWREGEGSWIVLELEGGEEGRSIDKMEFRNRVGRRNHRVRLTFSDASEQLVELNDTSDTTTYSLVPVCTSWVRITVETLYSDTGDNGAREIKFFNGTTEVGIGACSTSSNYPYAAKSGDYSSSCEPPTPLRLSSVWGTQSEGVGSWIQLGGFNASERLDAMLYVNKCGVNRTKQLRLDFSDGASQIVVAENTCDHHTIFFEDRYTTSVRVTVESMYSQEESVCCICNHPYKRMTRDLTELASKQTAVCQGFAPANSGVEGDVAEQDDIIMLQTQTPATQLVDELAMLLTPGRLSDTSRAIIADNFAHADKHNSEGLNQAFKQALKLFSVAPDFHATNKPAPSISTRDRSAVTPSQGRPYKAIVAVQLSGGADSFNMVVPHSECTEHDLYAEYATIRGGSLALDKNSLLQVDVTGSSPQPPCGKFGLHPKLEFLQEAFNAKDVVIMNNVGVMVEPMTADEYNTRKKRQPLGNFGHGGMQRGMQSLSAYDKEAKGILGRMIQYLNRGEARMKSDLYSVMGATKILEGAMIPNIVQSRVGMIRYGGYSALKNPLNALNENRSGSIFAETFSNLLESSLSTTEELGNILDATALSATDTFGGGNSVSAQLREVAKLIKMDTVDRQMERAGFVVEQRGYDTHNSFDLDELMTALDSGLRSFATELKAQGLWDNVTVVLISDFGRTLTSNTQGTDHGWGGQSFMLGGGVRGGRMVGKFPAHLLEEESDVSIGRGRILPTTPWEAVWSGLAEWWGITDRKHIGHLLPNAQNWLQEELFNRTHLFKN